MRFHYDKGGKWLIEALTAVAVRKKNRQQQLCAGENLWEQNVDPGILHDYFYYRLHCAGEELFKEILIKRFGHVPTDVAGELRYCHDLELLKDWILAANSAESLDGFRHYIFHTAPATIE